VHEVFFNNSLIDHQVPVNPVVWQLGNANLVVPTGQEQNGFGAASTK
jgi:hypothetical protein